MRLRTVEQMGSNIAEILGDVDADTAAAIRSKLPSLRYQRWHGKWAAAIERMRGIYRGAGAGIGSLRPVDAERVERFRQHMVNLRDYLKNNWSSLTNYGHAASARPQDIERPGRIGNESPGQSKDWEAAAHVLVPRRRSSLAAGAVRNAG